MLRTPHKPGLRFSKKKYELNLASWIEQVNTEHRGHTITYKSGGELKTGIIRGASAKLIDLEDDYTTLLIRVDRGEGVFPELIYIDQVVSCSCSSDHD